MSEDNDAVEAAKTEQDDAYGESSLSEQSSCTSAFCKALQQAEQALVDGMVIGLSQDKDTEEIEQKKTDFNIFNRS
jgi:hypothetical protein